MDKQDFGKKLIEIRNAKGLTQVEVAEMCNLTTRTIQRIETNIVNPRAYTIKLISETLGFDFFESSGAEDEIKTQNFHSNHEKHSILWYLKDLFNLKTHAMKKISILSASFLMIGFLFFMNSEGKAQSQNMDAINGLTIQLNEDHSIRKIKAVFTNNLTLDSLMNIKNELETYGIVIEYKNITFDKKNLLSSIDCDVNCNDGFGGSFKMAMLDVHKSIKKVGFFRDYTKTTDVSFCTGICGL